MSFSSRRSMNDSADALLTRSCRQSSSRAARGGDTACVHARHRQRSAKRTCARVGGCVHAGDARCRRRCGVKRTMAAARVARYATMLPSENSATRRGDSSVSADTTSTRRSTTPREACDDDDDEGNIVTRRHARASARTASTHQHRTERATISGEIAQGTRSVGTRLRVGVAKEQQQWVNARRHARVQERAVKRCVAELQRHAADHGR
jgi:hypothetical protein